MTSVKNIAPETMDDFLRCFMEEEKLFTQKADDIAIIYKHPFKKFVLTLYPKIKIMDKTATYYKSTSTVLFQGKIIVSK